jgi:hypothetical protein
MEVAVEGAVHAEDRCVKGEVDRDVLENQLAQFGDLERM